MKIKVVSFNIRNNDDPNGHSVNERAPRIKKIIDGIKPDIMGFQEVVPAWLTHISEDYLNDYEMYHVTRAEGDPEACPIFWRKDRFDLVKKGLFWLSDTPEVQSRGWDEVYNCYRVVLWAVLKDKTSGEEVLYMNTHFGFGDKGQSASAELIGKKAPEIADIPTVLTGDFNLTPEFPAYSVLTKYFTDVNAVTARDWNPTYHAYNDSTINPVHIDYTFINAKVTPILYTVLNETFDGKFPSDHYGLLTVLETK